MKKLPISFRVTPVENVQIFYREAGDPEASAVLRLHGFPTASHMFRDLIPQLAEEFHVFAPDLPGLGNTVVPANLK